MADASKPHAVAFWLVPAEPRRSSLAELIAVLGKAHGGPAFEPHITLHVSRAPGGPSPEALLDRVARVCEPMTLVAGATAHSEAHFRTLFVEFDDPRLFALQRHLRDDPGHDAGYLLRPHLSLLYRGGLPVATRERLAQSNRLAGERIEFDALVAVRPSSAGGDLADIEAIDTSLRLPLRRTSGSR
ncbi:MAG: hypothetical protein KJZ98_00345 [Burkholderiaceae bacterium]|nr:hypothetical protein [Burkholderiaceae bacterium]MEB2350316.1 hypothetical protein [Burkholderiaceae bacterium]